MGELYEVKMEITYVFEATSKEEAELLARKMIEDKFNERIAIKKTVYTTKKWE